MFIFRRPPAAVAAGLGAALLVLILDRACERSGTTLAAEGHGSAMDRPLARLPGESQSQGADADRQQSAQPESRTDGLYSHPPGGSCIAGLARSFHLLTDVYRCDTHNSSAEFLN
jgi:hypothetical protein